MKLKRVIFEFEDGSKLILKGKELSFWETALMLKSDYLLPQEPDDVLGKMLGGLVQGFFSREWAVEQLAKQERLTAEAKGGKII